ncbi:MAG: hypothetical protein M1820_003864 [Bogoriella megaspora]|nr:MAG: hypothetical protein M1820_003864 [Bogoriella megaspora]
MSERAGMDNFVNQTIDYPHTRDNANRLILTSSNSTAVLPANQLQQASYPFPNKKRSATTTSDRPRSKTTVAPSLSNLDDREKLAIAALMELRYPRPPSEFEEDNGATISDGDTILDEEEDESSFFEHKTSPLLVAHGSTDSPGLIGPQADLHSRGRHTQVTNGMNAQPPEHLAGISTERVHYIHSQQVRSPLGQVSNDKKVSGRGLNLMSTEGKKEVPGHRRRSTRVRKEVARG